MTREFKIIITIFLLFFFSNQLSAFAKSLNKEIDEKLLQEEKKKLADQADKKASVWHTTSEVWDDGVIDPRETRKYL